MIGADLQCCKGTYCLFESAGGRVRRKRCLSQGQRLQAPEKKKFRTFSSGVRPEYEPCQGTSQALQMPMSCGRLSTSALRSAIILGPFQISSAGCSSRLPRTYSLLRSRQQPTTRPAKSTVKLTQG